MSKKAQLNAKISLALLFCDPYGRKWAKSSGLTEFKLRLLKQEIKLYDTMDEVDFKRWVFQLPGNGVQTVAGAVYPVLNESIPDESPDELLQTMARRFSSHLSALINAL